MSRRSSQEKTEAKKVGKTESGMKLASSSQPQHRLTLDNDPSSLRSVAEIRHVGKPAHRILMLITTLTFGGAETQVVRLSRELKKSGFEISVASMIAPDAYVSELQQSGIPVDSLGMKRGVPDVRAIFRLASLIQRYKPDIVHSHMYHANILGRITRLVCRIPVLVCTAHNYKESSEKGGPTWHKELFYRLTDRLADRTTIICKAAYERYIRVGAVPREKFTMIPNGVNIEVFSPSLRRRAAARKELGVESKFVWLAVGRLVKQKDYSNLFRALQSIKDRDLILLIAGSGPLQEDLKLESRQRGLERHVRFCGTSETILDLYSAADAFVMSSQYEGLSAALLEASAMALPAVVTDVGGNADVVVHGKTGYLVPPRNADSLAAAMAQLMNLSKGEQLAFSHAAREHCCNEYRLESITSKWIDLYASCSA